MLFREMLDCFGKPPNYSRNTTIPLFPFCCFSATGQDGTYIHLISQFLALLLQIIFSHLLFTLSVQCKIWYHHTLCYYIHTTTVHEPRARRESKHYMRARKYTTSLSKFVSRWFLTAQLSPSMSKSLLTDEQAHSSTRSFCPYFLPIQEYNSIQVVVVDDVIVVFDVFFLLLVDTFYSLPSPLPPEGRREIGRAHV